MCNGRQNPPGRAPAGAEDTGRRGQSQEGRRRQGHKPRAEAKPDARDRQLRRSSYNALLELDAILGQRHLTLAPLRRYCNGDQDAGIRIFESCVNSRSALPGGGHTPFFAASARICMR